MSSTTNQLGPIVERLAAATAVIRVRAADAQRIEAHGGTLGERAARVEAAVAGIEAAARKFIKALD